MVNLNEAQRAAVSALTSVVSQDVGHEVDDDLITLVAASSPDGALKFANIIKKFGVPDRDAAEVVYAMDICENAGMVFGALEYAAKVLRSRRAAEALQALARAVGDAEERIIRINESVGGAIAAMSGDAAETVALRNKSVTEALEATDPQAATA